MVQPQRSGGPSSRSSRALRDGHLWRRWLRLPLWALLLRGGCLATTLALAVRYPPSICVAAAATIWALWPVLAVRHGAVPTGARHGARIAVRYLGGHPALRFPGRGWLGVWPLEGAALLCVGRRAIPFSLSSVRSVALADGRTEIPTGLRGVLARLAARALTRGIGRYCGLVRRGEEDAAVVDRSRVVCELVRQGTPYRVVLTGPRGGGEEIYLEVLVALRPAAALRGSGSGGGLRGTGAAAGS
jgi:hypothetical protein